MFVSKKIIHQTLACSPVILNQLMVGVGWGWTAPTLVKLKNPDSTLHFTTDQISWLASISEIGRVLGPFISPFLVDNFGRKSCLVLLSIMYFMVWLLIHFANSTYILYGARFLFGFANGINDVVAAIYTTENCSPSFRGIIGSIVQLTFSGAVFIEFIIATYMSYSQTAIANLALASCVFASLYFGTETPYFLIMKGKRKEAEKSLIWLSGSVGPSEVADELQQIESSVSEEQKKTKSLTLLLSSPANLKGIVVVVVLYILLTAVGGIVIVTYAALIFSPSETFTASQFVILNGMIHIAAVVLTPFIIEKINRRILIIGCFGGVTVTNICSSVLIYLRNKGLHVRYYPWLLFCSITAYGMFQSVMGPALYALKGELLPLSVRAIGSSITITVQSMTSFCIVKSFLPISESYGMEINFLMFSVASILATFIIYYILPETRGKTLHELQNMQQGNSTFNEKEKERSEYA